MTNECLGCKINCCRSFLIYKDLVDKNWWEREGKKNLGIFTKDYITGRFYCKNFDEKNGRCNDYENRPEICKNTGKQSMTPHNKCLLNKKSKNVV